MSYKDIKVELCSSWGGDRNAADAAWVSSTKKELLEAKTDSDVARVVTGLVNMHHDTPKERLWLEFFMTVPIFIERQFDKYRMSLQYQDIRLEYLEAPFGRLGMTQNELSGRYRTIPERPYGLPGDVADVLVKAGNSCYPDSAPYKPEDFTGQWDDILREQHEQYSGTLQKLKEAEKAGAITNAEYKRVREVIRGMLGTAYMTDMRIVMNLNAFEHIVNQRLAPDAQLESRIVAALMVNEAVKVAPVMVSEMMAKNGWDITALLNLQSL